MKHWSNTISFVLATTGAAVGLGNIWQFPALVSQGGLLFVVLYLLCVLVVGLPMMVAELVLGQSSQHNAVIGMQRLCHNSHVAKQWSWISLWGLGTLFLIVSFYSVVSGWSLHYIYLSITQQLITEHSDLLWQQLNQSYATQILWLTVFIGLTAWVITNELKQGIEWISNRIMPIFFMILLVITITTLTHQGFEILQQQLLTPTSLSFLTTLKMALGQALFSLAVGAGCLFTYGAYLPKNQPLMRSTFIIIILNVSVGLMSAATLLTVNGTSLSHEGGNLMFVALPQALANIPYHSTILLSFFLLLFFAAWTSAISLLEPIVLTLSNQFNIERKVMAWIMALIIWVVGALCCLYPSWFNNIRTFSTDLMLPLGALGYMIFTGWKLDRNLIQTHLHQNRWLWFMIQFIVPVLIIGILTLH